MPRIKSREKTTEQLEEDLRKTREELAIQKWGVEKTLGGMKVLVKELIQMGREVEEARAQDEAVLLSIGDGVVATDKDGKIILVNLAAEQMLDQKAEQLIGKFFFDAWEVLDEKGNLVIEAERPIAIALIKGTTTTTTTTTTTGRSYFYTRKDGTKFPVAITVTPVLAINKIIGAIDVFRDITKEKNIDNAKTEFVSLASHQLRTPSSGVKAVLSMLTLGDYGQFKPKQKEMLNKAYQANEQQITIINSLLNVARIDAGTLTLKKERTDIGRLAQEALTENQTTTLRRKQILKFVASAKKITTLIDPQMVRMAISNLISNAIKYTPDGGVITVSVSQNAKSISISIEDSGIGISQEDLPKLFNRFYRSHKVTAITGSGLGLYIAKNMISAHKGTIEVVSELKKGSKFTILLPKNET